MRKSLLFVASLVASFSIASAQEPNTKVSLGAWDANDNYVKIAQDFETELYEAELDDLWEIDGWVFYEFMNSGTWMAFTLGEFDADGYADVNFLDNIDVCRTSNSGGYYGFKTSGGWKVCYAWPVDGPSQAEDPDGNYKFQVRRVHLYDSEQSEGYTYAYKEKDENGIEQTYVTIMAYAYTDNDNKVYFDGGTGTYYFYIDFMLPNEADESGVSVLESDDQNAPVEFFNLQGVKVENPENGIFIRRQGSKTTKVVIK